MHAVSVPYAVCLFQGTQLFNRELTIKPRINNNNSNPNVQQRVENPMPQLLHPQLPHPQLLHPTTMRNPFDTISKFGNDGSGRLDRIREHEKTHEKQHEQSSLRTIPTKASMQMQPQLPHRFNNQPPANALNLNDLNKLISLGSNMLQSSSRHQADIPTRPAYDMLFADREVSDRHSSNLKMTNRHSRSHYRDEPYARRDPPRHEKRRSSDRRRR